MKRKGKEGKEEGERASLPNSDFWPRHCCRYS